MLAKRRFSRKKTIFFSSKIDCVDMLLRWRPKFVPLAFDSQMDSNFKATNFFSSDILLCR